MPAVRSSRVSTRYTSTHRHGVTVTPAGRLDIAVAMTDHFVALAAVRPDPVPLVVVSCIDEHRRRRGRVEEQAAQYGTGPG